MNYGVTIFASDGTWNVHELAVAAEQLGFDSFYLPEHTHIPTSRITPPPTGDAVLAEEYRRNADPLVALTAAAALTSTITLGTGVLLPAQREPIVTAKAIASLDQISNGRFVAGVGFGWNVDEMNHHGVEYRTRRAQAREHVLAMQQLWYHEEAEFHGEFVEFSPSWSWPKPAGRIPLLVGGGAGPKMFDHIAEYGDGWIPIGSAGIAAALSQLRDAWDRRDRDFSTCRIVPFGVMPSHDKLDYLAANGVTEAVFRLPALKRDVAFATLESQAELIAQRR